MQTRHTLTREHKLDWVSRHVSRQPAGMPTSLQPRPLSRMTRGGVSFTWCPPGSLLGHPPRWPKLVQSRYVMHYPAHRCPRVDESMEHGRSECGNGWSGTARSLNRDFRSHHYWYAARDAVAGARGARTWNVRCSVCQSLLRRRQWRRARRRCRGT